MNLIIIRSKWCLPTPPPPLPPAAAAAVAAPAVKAAAVAAASDKSTHGESVLDKFHCNKSPPNIDQ